MLDRAVLACCVEGLEYDQHGVAVLGVKHVLVASHQLDVLLQFFLRLGFVFEMMCISGAVIGELDLLARRNNKFLVIHSISSTLKVRLGPGVMLHRACSKKTHGIGGPSGRDNHTMDTLFFPGLRVSAALADAG